MADVNGCKFCIGHGRNQEGLDPRQKNLSRAIAAVQIFSEGVRPSWVRPWYWPWIYGTFMTHFLGTLTFKN